MIVAPATVALDRAQVAWRGLGALACGVALLLVTTAHRYGHHRDELYFLRAGARAPVQRARCAVRRRVIRGCR